MPVDALELQIVSALQRFTRLKQSADNIRSESPGLATRVLTELETALEELRVAQDQLVENRSHLERLQTELTQQCGKYWELFELMPAAYVVTTPDSTITEANKAAAELFNVSQRFLIGKTLGVFVSEDRARILTEVVPAVRAAGVGGADVQDAAAGARGRRCLRTRQRRHPVAPLVDSDAAAVERRARSTAVAFPPFAPRHPFDRVRYPEACSA